MLSFAESERLHNQAQRVLATGVSSGMRKNVTPTPLYFERAEGPYFFDCDGNRMLDYTLAWGPLIVGSNHPHINQVVGFQLQQAYAFGAQHPIEIEVASKLVDMVPGLEQVIFSNTGSEAVQAALRIARAKTGRDKIVKFEGHYHGWMNNVLVSFHPTSGSDCEAQPTCGGQPVHEYADTYVLPWNDLDSLRELFARCGEQIACVLTEPLLANSGSCEPLDGYLQGVIDLCAEYGAVSIFDEVITGFRIAPGGAREYFGVNPDLSVYGKAIAGGFSLSAVGGSAEMFDVLRTGKTFHAGTYNGNPICLAAAKAVLEILEQEETFRRMRHHGSGLKRQLQESAAQFGIPLSICGADTVFSVHWGVEKEPRNYRETLNSDIQTYTKFRLAMLEHGVYLLPDARWYVGAAHDREALQVASEAIHKSMQSMELFVER